MQPHKSRNNRLFWLLISFAIAVAVGNGIYTAWEWTKPCFVTSEKRIWGRCYRDLQAKPLTIGIAIGGPDEDYNALAGYLRNQLGSQVEIDINTPYEELSDRIARQDWDIAFTRSPIFSIVAEDNHYIGVALMFPEQPPYYRAALYVGSDSPIQGDRADQANDYACSRKPRISTYFPPTYLCLVWKISTSSNRIST